DNLQTLLDKIEEAAEDKFKYAEIRTVSAQVPTGSSFQPYDRHHLHVLDLRHPIEHLYARLHYDSVRRKIRRAEREHVVLDQGRSESMLQEFYGLLVLTRRRHQLPPQPLEWFQELVKCFGNKLTIHIARLNRRPIASILTLRHKQSLTYKYGCSDARFHKVGAMPCLFWQVMQEAKQAQLTVF